MSGVGPVGASVARGRRAAAEWRAAWAATIRSGAARRIGLALAIGTLGALIAHQLHVPLAFMMGSLFGTMLACFLRAPIEPPIRLRGYFLVVIGLFLSEGFTQEVAASAVGWWPSLLLAIAYPVLIGALCYVLYVRLGAMGRAEALFCALPGGLSGVVVVAGAFGADERSVALNHALRVAMVVLLAPAVFFGALGYSEPDLSVPDEALISWGDAALLGAASLAAILIGRRINAPVPQLLAPLAVGAALRGAGVVEGALPALLVEAALVVLGASIGARFVGVRLAALGRLALWTLFGTVVMVVGTVLFALLATATTPAPLLPAILAFAPGGVAEMTLISIALDSEPAYVAAHHLARLGFILLATPFVAPALGRLIGAAPSTPPDR